MLTLFELYLIFLFVAYHAIDDSVRMIQEAETDSYIPTEYINNTIFYVYL